jgi:WD40 repeat protein
MWETPIGQGRGKPILLNVELLNLRFAPNGQNLLATAKDGSVHLIDLSGQPINPSFSVPTYVTASSFSPDGKTYLLGTVEGLLQYRDLLGTKERYSIRTGTRIEALGFSPDGRTFLAGDRNGTLWHRETDTGRAIGEPFRTDSPFWSVQFTPDGHGFLAGTDGGAQLWDLETHAITLKTPVRGQVTHISIRPDGKTAQLNIDGFAREWNFATDGTMHSSLFQPEGGIDRIALSQDGKRVLVTGTDKIARLWDVSTGKQLGPSLGTRARPVAFSQGDRLMAVGDWDGRIYIWEVSTPVPQAPARIRLWIETLTRMELDSTGTVRYLSDEEVEERARQLENAGGPPST